MSKWVKRVLAVVLVGVLVGGAAPMGAVFTRAATGYGSNGKFLAAIDPPATGSIPIANRAELEAIADNPSGKYHLITDIELSDQDWLPIGNNNRVYLDGQWVYPNRFTGIFDGQGYVIRNLKITSDREFSGLFGYAYNAIVKNVGMEYTSIYSNTGSAGAICGSFYGGSIYNCYITGDISATSAGGVCGSNSGNISSCYNTGKISASDAGGICGSIGSGSISSCFNMGEISSSSLSIPTASNAGGICGSVSNSTISTCYNEGTVKATAVSESPASYAGGICGALSKTSTDSCIINDCYNTGIISASSSPPSSYSYSRAGGICGAISRSVNGSGSISNCYNAGNTLSSGSYAYIGAICSFSNGGIISNCYWNIDNSQTLNNNALTNTNKKGLGNDTDITTRLSAAQMKQKTFFTGFDFDNIWGIDISVNDGYPYLRVFVVDTDPISLVFGEYSAIWDENLFSFDPNAKNYSGSQEWKELAVITSILSGLVYGGTAEPLFEAFRDVGLSGVFYNPASEILEPGYAFGYKQILRNGEKKDLVVAVFRGTEWATALNGWTDIATDVLQAIGGINAAAAIATLELYAFMELLGIDADSAVFLVTGHSLGGGMANCVANSLSDKYSESNVFAFTFASPKTALQNFFPHDNISNFISENDFTPTLGPGWPLYGGFHYGRNYYVTTPYSIHPFGACHEIESYIKGVMDMTGKGLVPGPYNMISVRCPVDIEVYDSNDALIGKITNNAVVNGTVVPALVVSDDKYFILNANEQVSLKLLASDSGTMKYTITTIDSLTEEMISEKTFSNVTLITDKQMASEVGGDIDTPDVQLLIMKNDEPIGEIDEDGNETLYSGYYAVTVINGDGSGYFKKGATVSIMANDPPTGQVFDKWTTSDDVTFADMNSPTTTFIMPAGAATVTAIFKDEHSHTHVYNAQITTQPTCTAAGVTTYTCVDNDHTYTQELPAALGHDFSVKQSTVAPTYDAQGYTVYKCSRCAATENRDFTAKLTPAKGIFGTNAKWYGAWWHYILFFFCFGFIWMWFC